MAEVSNRKIQWTISSFFVSLYFCSLSAQAQYGGGTGEPNNPYLIYTAEHLNAIGMEPNDWDKHFKLMADIDLAELAGISFNIIGANRDHPFTGVFNGSGHTIWNFTHHSNDTVDIGLFGCINDEDAEVKNLSLIEPSVDAAAARCVASLVGALTEGIINGCHVLAGTVRGGSSVGGLVGHIQWGTVNRCSSTATVTGYSTVGGLAGKNYGGSIMNSCSTGSVTGESSIGGLVGSNMGFADITNCYATGDVTGNRNVAGIAGHNSCREARRGTIQCCYSVGKVTGTEYVGSIVGWNCGAVESSFWDIQTTGMDEPDYGEGRTTAEMQDPDTFRAAGWDFVGPVDGPIDIWAIPADGGYPILWWQLPPPTEQAFSGGIGQSDDPYLISTPDELNSLSHNPGLMTAHFKLINDIDLLGVDFRVIGSELFPFAGTFDGNGRKILNLSLTCPDARNIGLFGHVDYPDAQIKDLGLIGPSIDAQGGWNVGSLVGYLKDGTIDGCYARGFSISGESDVGGLVGETWGTVMNCLSAGNVSGDARVGGLVGSNRGGGTLVTSFSSGSVLGQQTIGGLAGLNLYGDVASCYSTSSIRGADEVGGLVGDNRDDVRDCYSTGLVKGEGHVGGLVGSGSARSVRRSFWDIQTSGQPTSAGGVGMTTPEMQTATTFLEFGWDFVDETANGTEDIWWILEGQHYPRLWWQYGKAFSPYPQDGAVDVPQPLTLSWLPGGSDLYHDVYFGEDREAMVNATTESLEIYRGRQKSEITTYNPGNLELVKAYYWRIDEVRETDPNIPWKGDVWSFTTANFIVVDDFESYKDYYNEIWFSWHDGLGYGAYDNEPYYLGNGTGAVVGDETGMWGGHMETEIVHDGRQSMPYFYDNNRPNGFKYSEAEKTLSYPRDWTEEDVSELSLWFYGVPTNDPEPMYVAIANKAGAPAVIYHYDPNAVRIDTWIEWTIPLQTFADQGIDLIDVDRIAIGFGTRGNLTVPGGRGKMYFDDIRLYRSRQAVLNDLEVNIP